jgi:hypothetical protein
LLMAATLPPRRHAEEARRAWCLGRGSHRPIPSDASLSLLRGLPGNENWWGSAPPPIYRGMAAPPVSGRAPGRRSKLRASNSDGAVTGRGGRSAFGKSCRRRGHAGSSESDPQRSLLAYRVASGGPTAVRVYSTEMLLRSYGIVADIAPERESFMAPISLSAAGPTSPRLPARHRLPSTLR